MTIVQPPRKTTDGGDNAMSMNEVLDLITKAGNAATALVKLYYAVKKAHVK